MYNFDRELETLTLNIKIKNKNVQNYQKFSLCRDGNGINLKNLMWEG